jgi:hypothetical protein
MSNYDNAELDVCPATHQVGVIGTGMFGQRLSGPSADHPKQVMGRAGPLRRETDLTLLSERISACNGACCVRSSTKERAAWPRPLFLSPKPHERSAPI